MNWTKVLDDGALAEGDKMVVPLAQREVLLIRHRGQVFATESRCPHLGWGLKSGKITEDGHLVCQLHHSEYDLRTGEVLTWAPWPPVVGPALGAIREKRGLVVYPTRVSEGAIWVGTE